MSTKVKWYNDTEKVGGLLICWPPLGIYGIYRSETIDPKWKKITTAVLLGVGVILAVICTS